jgi:proteic killer suppression protein
VIKSFADARDRANLEWSTKRRLPSEIQPLALRKRRMLNQARTLADLRVPPGNRLEILRGERRSQYSIRIDRQWWICFR